MLEKKIREIMEGRTLAEAYPGAGKNKEEKGLKQGSSQEPEVEKMGVKQTEPVTANAPLGPGAGAKENAPHKQGDSKDASHEELDGDAPGKTASAKAKKQPVLKNSGAGSAPNFSTVADPASVINQPSSKGNTVREEKCEDDEKEEKDSDKKGEDKEEKSEKKGKKAPPFVKESVATLFAGDTSLTEEFKEKASGLFEALVEARISELSEEIEEALAEEAAQAVATIKEELVGKMDAYLSYVTEKWMEENALAVESGLRAELTEGFISGLKTLFQEHYIEVPDEKLDVLGDMQETIEQLEAQITEQEEAKASLAEEIVELQKAQVFNAITEGLALTEREKLAKLTEALSFESDETYRSKLQVVKENYFPKAPKATSEILTEEVESGETSQTVSPTISKYVEAISRTVK